MEIKEIVNRISYFRTKRKMSARELSLQIGKSESYIKKLEHQKFNLSSQILLDIIAALEVKPQEFFADNYQTYYIDKELYDAIIKLPEDIKKNYSDIIKKIKY